MSRVSRLRIRMPRFLRWALAIVLGVTLLGLSWLRLLPNPLAAGLAAYKRLASGR